MNACCWCRQLWLAAQQGDEATARKLAQRVVLECARSEKHVAKAVHVATLNDHGLVLDALLSAGDFVNVVDAWGRPPLWVASTRDATDAARRLLDANANPNSYNCLDVAVKRGHVGMVSLLLQSKASVTDPPCYVSISPSSPAATAVRCGQGAVLQLLLQAKVLAGSTHASAYGTMTLMDLAVRQDYPDVVRLLLRSKASANARSDGATPVYRAVQRGQGRALALLVNAKARVNGSASNWNATPLIAAARIGPLPGTIIPALLRAKADIDEVDVYGRTPAHHALFTQHWVALRLLLDAGCDMMNKRACGGGWSLLHEAAAEFSPEGIRVLLADEARRAQLCTCKTTATYWCKHGIFIAAGSSPLQVARYIAGEAQVFDERMRTVIHLLEQGEARSPEATCLKLPDPLDIT